MKVTFEGTTEEIATLFPHLSQKSNPVEAVAGVEGRTLQVELPTTEADEDSPVSTEFARKVLSRLPLAKQQRDMLRAIYAAHPDRISSAELVRKIGYRHQQFVGLMGAFGRRIGNTEGHIDGSWFFDVEWDQATGSNYYKLPETVREALRLEKIV